MLGLGHRTMVSHGNHTRINLACLTRLFSGTACVAPVLRPRPKSFLILLFSFLGLHGPGEDLSPPSSWLLPSPFILTFPLSYASTCRFRFLGLVFVFSTHTQSGWGWLLKLKSMVKSMNLLGAEYLITVLTAFYLDCSYIVLALSFRNALGCRGQNHPRLHP